MSVLSPQIPITALIAIDCTIQAEKSETTKKPGAVSLTLFFVFQTYFEFK